ncbi:putative holin-like toxin [Bacillus sp. RO1]|nr:putative holin-like toxin [Bacillus sp. RO1]
MSELQIFLTSGIFILAFLNFVVVLIKMNQKK